MAPSIPNHSRSRLLNTFAGVALGVIVVAVLYFAHTIFIPLALAVFLSFIMAPIVERAERWIGRTVAVIGTVLAVAAFVVSIGWMVTHELAGLAETLSQPAYEQNIGKKVNAVQHWIQARIVDKVKHLTTTVEENASAAPSDGAKSTDEGPQPDSARPPTIVRIPPASSAPGWLSVLPGSLGRVAEALGQTALVVVLVVFMLLRREDLRNRVIRLIGHGRLTATTLAIDEATARVSRFLFAQLVVNGCYGLVFAAGLWCLGVPYAFLWGFLAAVMRYVPYVGIWLAVLPPVVLSLAVAPGWSLPIWVVGLVTVMELACANFIEPMLFGQSIGVSEVALLVSAAFWAWLWGPIGLILSAPLTVCLVVLGKYVPHLEFFDIMLGDAPVMPPRLTFFQRLLARDQDEAAAVVEKFAETASPDAAYDEFLIPALVTTRRAVDHHDLAETEQKQIETGVLEIAEQISAGDFAPLSAKADSDRASSEPTRVHILGCPARDEGDELAMSLFGRLLNADRWDLEIVPVAALAAELIDRVYQTQPAVIVIAALPPGGLAHTRYLCKRLRQRFDDVRIAIGLWGLEGDTADARKLLAEAGADHIATTMLETRSQLAEWLPVFDATAPHVNGEAKTADRGSEKV
jgi:predicted PurR-regulated permease PerM